MEIQTRSDMMMVERAANERWQMTNKQRTAIVKKLVAIIASSKATNRDKIRAASTLAALDRVNVQEQPKQTTNVNLNLALQGKKQELRERLEALTEAGNDDGDQSQE